MKSEVPTSNVCGTPEPDKQLVCRATIDHTLVSAVSSIQKNRLDDSFVIISSLGSIG